MFLEEVHRKVGHSQRGGQSSAGELEVESTVDFQNNLKLPNGRSALNTTVWGKYHFWHDFRTLRNPTAIR